MDENNVETLVKVLRSLCGIFERNQNDDEELIHKKSLTIEKYKINLNFYYNSVAIVMSYDNNFNVFFIVFEKEKETNIEDIKKMLCIFDLPLNLLIQKLNQIGIDEV